RPSSKPNSRKARVRVVWRSNVPPFGEKSHLSKVAAVRRSSTSQRNLLLVRVPGAVGAGHPPLSPAVGEIPPSRALAMAAPGPYSGVSTLAFVARASLFTVGMVYGSLKLSYLKVFFCSV
ncbi:hypothetical protein Taro_031825, partial [Colocasia esculenta]|nr:hypothetical protein [Colocasia esculenta]